MNENAKAWVAALRSGEYEQGKRALHPTKNTYCCLGVACELYRQANGGTWQWYSDKGVFLDGLSILPTHSILPIRVIKWLGLKSTIGSYPKGNGRYESLAAQNDSGVTFNEIADVIESEPEGLFLPIGEKEEKR